MSLYGCVLLTLLAACSSPLDSRVSSVLDFAGDNRGELEAVLDYYRDDPEKLHAARLLIAEMEEAYYYDAPEVDSLRAVVRDTRWAATTPNPERAARWKAFDYRTLPKQYDARTLTADYLTEHIDRAFEAWRKWPWGRHYTYGDFCRYILPYRIGDETPDRWMGRYADYFGHLLDSLHVGNDPVVAADTAMRHIAKLRYFYMAEYDTPHLGASHLLEVRSGGCREHTDLLVYVFRSLGIPATKDMFLCAPDFRQSHTWAVLKDTTGRFIPVELTENKAPRNLRGWQNRRNKGKVYRLHNLRLETPDFAGDYHREDVTAEYYPANRVEVPGVETGGDGMLAVFASEGWRPVGGYRKRWGKAVVENVQEGMIFQPLAVRDGQLRESGWPFCVREGRAVVLRPDTARRVRVRLTRKYPIGWRLKERLDQVAGNWLEGSNDPAFRTADSLGRVDGSRMDVLGRCLSVPAGRVYRYLRLWPAPGRVVHLAELECLADTLGREPLPYRIVSCGTPNYLVSGTQWPEHLHDGDVLSVYRTQERDVPVVVDFGRPVSLRAVVLTPRNDDNFVRRGETYELFYQDGVNGWTSLGRQVAATGYLEYDNVPDNALLWLRNLTKGREEQVFRWVDGQQVFLGTMKGG